jgi:hypothetical protein
MKRLRLVTEAQPTDPVREGVLLVDGQDAEQVPDKSGSVSTLVASQTAGRDGRRHSVNVTIVRTRWSVETLTEAIARDVLDAAESAGLDMDAHLVRIEARRIAKRELNVLRRWFG